MTLLLTMANEIWAAILVSLGALPCLYVGMRVAKKKEIHQYPTGQVLRICGTLTTHLMGPPQFMTMQYFMGQHSLLVPPAWKEALSDHKDGEPIEAEIAFFPFYQSNGEPGYNGCTPQAMLISFNDQLHIDAK